MNISRLSQSSGASSNAQRLGKTDGRPTATPVAKPALERGTRVDENPDPALRTSPRLAAFEDSLQTRIDDMAKSGKLSDRQLAALQDVKEKLGSMMARLDGAFFDGHGLEGGASDVLSHILDLTSQSLGSILGETNGSGRTPSAGQKQFAYGSATGSVDVPAKSIDTLV